MEILKGRAQEPGFPDVEVTYLKTDDGQTYFFVEGGTLKNGNIIATPNLKEGIGHAPYTSLGLITPQGNILIPFENKNIKPLSSELLLVERNTPITPSVVDACNKHSDPLAVTDLVASATTIKEQLKSVMGTGEYVFDNQFSEAALYTTDGANLGGNYFSFIGVSNGSYYMCTNVVGDSIIKYDPYAVVHTEEEKDESVFEQFSVNSDVTLNEAGSLEQQNVPLVPEIAQIQDKNSDMNNSLESNLGQDSSNEVNISSNPYSTSENLETVEKEEQNADQASSSLIPNIDIPINNDVVVDNSDTISENISEDIQTDIPLNPQSEIQNDYIDVSTENDDGQGSEIHEENNPVDLTDFENVEKDVSLNEDIFGSQASSVELNNDTSESISVNDDSSSNESSDIEYTEVSEDDSFKYDTKEESQEEYDLPSKNKNRHEEEYFEEEIGNPIIVNATNTIRKLLEENRKQRQMIDSQESEIETLTSSNDILREENDSKTREIISLRNSTGKYRSQNSELSRENARLKSTNSRQEEIIEHLKNQNATLKEQVAGISALNNAVAEANTLFAPVQDNTSSYDRGFGYLDEDEDAYQYTKKVA